MPPLSALAPGNSPSCFHCGLALPTGPSFGFEGGDGWRAFCCAGCEAVSRSISGLGLDDYYRLREVAAARPDTANRRAGMDVPIALGLAAAFGASLFATLRAEGDVYFDSIAMFVFLLLGARYLEVVARARAGEAW